MLDNLVSAVKNPTLENHKAMQEASNLAGRAINLTKTTGAHAFCYYLTSHYNIPHGNAAAIMLAPFFVFNGKGESSVELEDLYKIMNVADAEEASALISDIMLQCGVPSRLSEVMDLDKDFDDFYDSVNLERLKNNPRQMKDARGEFLNLLRRY